MLNRESEAITFDIGLCKLHCKFEMDKAEYILYSGSVGWTHQVCQTGELKDLKEFAYQLKLAIDHIEKGPMLDFWKVR